MSKQFAVFFVSWRDAKPAPLGLFASETGLARAAAAALEAKLNQLAGEGWILERIIPAQGLTARHSSAFTIVAFK